MTWSRRQCSRVTWSRLAGSASSHSDDLITPPGSALPDALVTWPSLWVTRSLVRRACQGIRVLSDDLTKSSECSWPESTPRECSQSLWWLDHAARTRALWWLAAVKSQMTWSRRQGVLKSLMTWSRRQGVLWSLVIRECSSLWWLTCQGVTSLWWDHAARTPSRRQRTQSSDDVSRRQSTLVSLMTWSRLPGSTQVSQSDQVTPQGSSLSDDLITPPGSALVTLMTWSRRQGVL